MNVFSANISSWVKEKRSRMDRVFRMSVQDVVAVMQSRVPVDTGFCRASLTASLTAMPRLLTDHVPTIKEKGAYQYDGAVVTLTINQLTIDGTIYLGYTAAYAGALEYGHSNQAPEGFVRLAAQQWPQIVAANSSKLQEAVSKQ